MYFDDYKRNLEGSIRAAWKFSIVTESKHVYGETLNKNDAVREQFFLNSVHSFVRRKKYEAKRLISFCTNKHTNDISNVVIFVLFIEIKVRIISQWKPCRSLGKLYQSNRCLYCFCQSFHLDLTNIRKKDFDLCIDILWNYRDNIQSLFLSELYLDFDSNIIEEDFLNTALHSFSKMNIHTL